MGGLTLNSMRLSLRRRSNYPPSFPPSITVIPALYRRHSRERGNPEGSPSEIKYKQQPADPFSLYGLAGVGFDFGSFSRCWNLGDAGDGEPSQPSEIKYELKPADPFSLYGRRLG